MAKQEIIEDFKALRGFMLQIILEIESRIGEPKRGADSLTAGLPSTNHTW